MINREAKANFSLQFISHTNGNTTYLDGIRMALEGGCRWIQLRMKGAADSEVEPIAVEAQKMCREAGATFVIDDRVEMVKRLGADGVHLGKNDMPISEARRILGDTFIIGGTANTIADVEDHWKSGADYVGCGPFRFTTTKEKLSPVLGIGGYENIVAEMNRRDIGMPVVAIGGITTDDITAIMATGVSGIAVSGTILRADDPVEKTQEIMRLLAIHERQMP